MFASIAALVLACPPVVPTVGQTIPADGATVPANVAIVFESTVRDGTVTAMVLLTSALGGFSGSAVVGDGDVFVFDPGADLAAGDWTAFITLDSPTGGTGRTVPFVVGSGADIAAPELSGDVVFVIGDYVDAPQFGDCPDPPPVYAVATDWEDATDASAVLYAVRGILLPQSQMTIGAPASETLVLGIFAYDEAGNVGALPAATLDVPGPRQPDDGGCSCRLAPAKAPCAGTLVWALALAALGILRRTRERV